MHEEKDSNLEAWLIQRNILYKSQDEPLRARPLRAIQEYAQEFRGSFEQRMAENKRIFQFFEDRCPPGTFSVGNIYESLFFYEDHFWPISVPIIFGQVTMSAYHMAASIPQSIKEEIRSDTKQHISLNLFCADCMDYGHGFEETIHHVRPQTAALLKGADAELRGAMTLVENNGGNSRAMLSLGLSIEMFLKSFLVQELSLNENALKKLSHDLGKIAAECLKIEESNIFKILLRDQANIFPKIDTRYGSVNFEPAHVWKAIVIAQGISSTVIRKYSSRNLRAEIQKKIIECLNSQKFS